VRAAFKMVKDEAVSEDIVQEVIFKYLQKEGSISIKVKLSTYLHRAVTNQAIDYLRKEKRVVSLPLEDLQITEEEIVKTEEQEYLERRVKLALAELPEKCKEVFIMAKIQDMKYKEIAEELGISIKTVENQMGKAFKMLREKLKDTGKPFYSLLMFLT
jgi:RNA polymerase sigma-70 factor (ECF subfamily)